MCVKRSLKKQCLQIATFSFWNVKMWMCFRYFSILNIFYDKK